MLARLLAPLSVKHAFHRVATVMDLDADRSFLRAAKLLVSPEEPPEVDGDIFPIFPVDPLVDNHPEIDFYIGVNAFYPENFSGEDHTGWHEATFSVLRVSPQTKHCQHLEAARMQLRRIQDRCLMMHPLPYEEIRGIRLYEQFIDRRPWLDFMRRGHAAARRDLEALQTANQS